MKKILLFIFVIITLSSCSIEVQNSSESNRYQIIGEGFNEKTLLDTKTGESWRQTWGNDLGEGIGRVIYWRKNSKE